VTRGNVCGAGPSGCPAIEFTESVSPSTCPGNASRHERPPESPLGVPRHFSLCARHSGAHFQEEKSFEYDSTTIYVFDFRVSIYPKLKNFPFDIDGDLFGKVSFATACDLRVFADLGRLRWGIELTESVMSFRSRRLL